MNTSTSSLNTSLDSILGIPPPIGDPSAIPNPNPSMGFNPASLAGLGSMPSSGSTLPKTANFLAQLESMMSAVKKEAGALEHMKVKLKEMEEIKNQNSSLKQKLVNQEKAHEDLSRQFQEKERMNADLRQDMQQLNDIYHTDRNKLSDTLQTLNKLENEFNTMKVEKEFFQNESLKLPEYKKQIKQLKQTCHQMKTKQEEDQHQMTLQLNDYDKKYKAQEKKHTELSDHIWSLTEQINELKKENQLKQDQLQSLNNLFQQYKEKQQVVNDRQGMQYEDIFAFSYQTKHSTQSQQHKQQELTTQLQQSLKQIENLTLENQEYKQKNTQLTKYYEEKLYQTNNNMMTIQENYQEKLSELQKAQIEIKSIKTIELEQFQQKQDQLSSIIQQLQQQSSQDQLTIQSLQQKYQESQELNQMALETHEEIKEKHLKELEELQIQHKTQIQSYQTQIQDFKNNEYQLIEETDKLSKELQEKTISLHDLEREKITNQSVIQNELNESKTLIDTLKQELEKRIEELLQLKEFSQHQEEELCSYQQTFQQIQYDKNNWEKQQTILWEQEKNKLKLDMNKLITRIQSLENEKNHLLQEIQDVSNEHSQSSQRIQVQMKEEIDTLTKSNNEYQDKNHLLQKKFTHLTSDHEKVTNEYRTLQQNHEIQMKKHHEEIQSYQYKHTEKQQEIQHQLLTQLQDVNYQLKTLEKEKQTWSLQSEQYQLTNKQLDNQLQSYQAQLQHMQSQYQELQDTSYQNMNNIRLELSESRQKYKLLLENKTNLEMMTMNQNLKITQVENDLMKKSESLKTFEIQIHDLQEKNRSLQQTNESYSTQIHQLSSKLQDNDKIFTQQHNQLMIQLTSLQQNEKELNIENKKLLLKVNYLEHENEHELKQQLDVLQQENNELKQNQMKLLQSNQQMITYKDQETNKFEELLHKEKKLTQQLQSEQYQKTKEYENAMELLRLEHQDMINKMKLEFKEKEYKLLSYEKDIDYLNNVVVGHKSQRIDELEVQVSNQKKKENEFKEKYDILEKEFNDMKRQYESECNQRKRIENKLKTMMTNVESTNESLNLINSTMNTFGNSVSTPSNASNPMSNPFNSISNPMINPTDNNIMYYNSNSTTQGFPPMSNPGYLTSRSTHSSHANSNPSSIPNNNTNSIAMRRLDSRGNYIYSANGLSSNPNNARDPLSLGSNSLEDSYSSINNNSTSNFNITNVNNNNLSNALNPNSLLLSPLRPNFTNNGLNQNSVGETDVLAMTMNDINETVNQLRASSQVPLLPISNNPPSSSITGSNLSVATSSNNIAGQNPMYNSPHRNPPPITSMQHASPAVDRVSATLALKLAQQQQRNTLMQMTAADNKSITSQSSTVISSMSRPGSSAGHMLAPGPAPLSASAFQDEDLDFKPTNNSEVEESIRRAQLAINRRLEKGKSQGDVNSHQSSIQNIHQTPVSSSSNEIKTPNSGKSASKLIESIQHGHSMYPSSPIRNTNHLEAHFDEEAEEEVEAYNEDTPLSMSAPQPKPASPPSYGESPYSFNQTNADTRGENKPAGNGKKKKKAKKSSSAASEGIQLPKIQKT